VGADAASVLLRAVSVKRVSGRNRNLTQQAERAPNRDRVVVPRWFSALAFIALAACGGRSTRDLSSGSGGTGAGSGVTSGAGGGGTAGGLVTNSTGVDGLGCPGVPIADEDFEGAKATACMSLTVECGATFPHDLHLVVERSSRMLETVDGVSKWELVRRALEQFLVPSSWERVSLRLFGAGGVSDCDPAAYAAPVVPSGGETSTFAAIFAAMDALPPEGPAPTVAALAGTLEEVERVQQTTRDGQRVVLILGGAPTDCSGTPESLHATFARSPVTSYVIALAPDFDVGPVGEATETWPFVIEAGHSEQRLVDALRHIGRGASRQACDFGRSLPEEPPDIVPEHTRAFFAGDQIPHLANAEECARSEHGGFYLTELAGELGYRSCQCTCARYVACEGAQWMFYCQ
jgi:hypothetical protein